MQLQIQSFGLHRVELRTRMPFRYGIAIMTEVPLAFVRLGVELDGRRATGISSDLLPPKWFTKVPAKEITEEVSEMQEVILQAGHSAVGLKGENVFDLWRQLYEAQTHRAQTKHWPPLLAHFGTSLVERALLEAVCRLASRPFAQALRANLFGLELGALHPSLRGRAPADFLPAQPLARITARHTVGLSDPLTEADIRPEEKLEDGLPQSLEACLRTYGLSHFKIKLSGVAAQDLSRLTRVAATLRQHAPATFAFTLDGNEQFKAIAELREFWRQLTANRELTGFLRHLLFVEQPLHRDVALHPEVGAALRAWPDHPPLIIDESDGTLEDLPAALQLGYAGTSHKNCKGIVKGVAHACLLRQLESERRAPRPILSGEDLCNMGPVALLQDLAVMAALGIESVERNGHHYHAGLSQLPRAVWRQVLAQHSDLYQASGSGWPTLSIERGQLQLDSVNRAPFGVGFDLDLGPFTPVSG